MKAVGIIVTLCFLFAWCTEKPIGEMSNSELGALVLQLRARCVKEAGPVNSPAYEMCIQQYANQEGYLRRQKAIDSEEARKAIPVRPGWQKLNLEVGGKKAGLLKVFEGP